MLTRALYVNNNGYSILTIETLKNSIKEDIEDLLNKYNGLIVRDFLVLGHFDIRRLITYFKLKNKNINVIFSYGNKKENYGYMYINNSSISQSVISENINIIGYKMIIDYLTNKDRIEYRQNNLDGIYFKTKNDIINFQKYMLKTYNIEYNFNKLTIFII